MLIVISPSKTQEFEGRYYPDHTIPFFKSRFSELIDHMKTLSKKTWKHS